MFFPLFYLLFVHYSLLHLGSICSFFINLCSCLAYSIFALFFFKTFLFLQKRQTKQSKSKQIKNLWISNWIIRFSRISHCSFSQSSDFLKYCQVHCTLEVEALLRKWPASLTFFPHSSNHYVPGTMSETPLPTKLTDFKKFIFVVSS